ncbi:ABC transporter permease [Corallococcus sp. AS-1-12]|uniref:ABC transporter permease n=1 Tax=Corallococcus sp. AS-1-12 TaxID=2874598 RepID=UPI001CBFBC97|nr:ABC transporter permease [Corallococcus sp. AS-1-12]MBZ4331738.1 ABC transporter permease [Corallococcus sp. AS-1-12]
MSQLLQDLRLSLRRMRREPVFTTVVVATLALAIGATTAVFSLVYQVLLKPLPYPEPQELLRLYQSTPQRERGGVAYAYLQAWRERPGAFQAIEGVTAMDSTLTGPGAAQRVRAGLATPGLLSLLGVRPERGQDFGPESQVPGRDRSVLVSHEFWRSHLGGRADVVGQTLTLDGVPHVVQGVLPASFRFWPGVDLWKPLAPAPPGQASEELYLRGVGRLRPGVPLERARAELEEHSRAWAATMGGKDAAPGVRLVPLREQVVETSREQLWLLAGVMALVLCVACANVANLLLARASAREREVAVRAALGADRGRLVRQFLVESAVLALTGGAVGLLLAMWGMDLLRVFVPGEVVSPEELELEPHVLAIAAGLSLTTSVLFGLAPALRASRAEAKGALGGLRGGRGATGPMRARAVLVVAQVALALVPLVGAGLMLRTLHALHAVAPGFDPRGVSAMDLSFPREAYGQDDPRRRQVSAELLARVRALPSVQSAGLASTLPLWSRNGFSAVVLPGETEQEAQAREPVNFRAVSDGYFATLRIPLKEGRDVSAADGAGTAPVMVVNETFARRFLSKGSALGQRARLTLDGEPFREVVGVVGDVHHASLAEEPRAEVYLPMDQFEGLFMVLAVRASQDSRALLPALREQLRAVEPTLPLVQVRDLEAVVEESLGRTRVMSGLLTAMAVLALTLAGVGLYGVLAYTVSQRTRELGIRMALGATDRQVLWLVVGQGLRLAAIGVGVGLVGAAVLARGLSGMLYGVGALDALTFGGVPLLLGAVALMASWLPARRALRVTPAIALRADE